MNPEWQAVAPWTSAITAIASVVFVAGGLVWWVIHSRRVLNGLGQRVTRLEREAEDRYLALCLVVLCPEKKEEIAKLLQAWKRP